MPDNLICQFNGIRKSNLEMNDLLLVLNLPNLFHSHDFSITGHIDLNARPG
jgi:hypothetical protein